MSLSNGFAMPPHHRAGTVRRSALRALASRLGPWAIRSEPDLWEPPAGIARDVAMGEEVARTGLGVVRLWQGGRALVVTRREARLPSFARASEGLTREGWPVVVRESGGTAVPHLPGALQVSLIIPRAPLEGVDVEVLYHLLCEPVRVALRSMGLHSGYGTVDGSFCDGRFNLVHEGRKVAGTAQRWKGGRPGSEGHAGYVLSHMVLFVEGELREATEAVNRFLHLAGGDGRFRPEAQQTVAEALAGPADEDLLSEVRRRVEAAFRRTLGVVGRRGPLRDGAVGCCPEEGAPTEAIGHD